jgi:hypothetical protein
VEKKKLILSYFGAKLTVFREKALQFGTKRAKSYQYGQKMAAKVAKLGCEMVKKC